jgi:pyruvate kinase
MKKDCVLIATLPSLSSQEKVRRVFENPWISEVRFNTGCASPMPVEETLQFLKDMSVRYNKRLWIDLKGRQLRITKWADPLYSCVELSHKIEILYPAKIYFRNGACVNITHVKDGNRIFVDPIPREVVGAGQSVNILARDVEIFGYLTEKDLEYLKECKELELFDIMASFVEGFDDLTAILQVLPKAHIVSKIESLKGVEFIKNNKIPYLMAARDDLYIQSGQNFSMLGLLKTIIEVDGGAICASRIFSSLEKRENVDFADFADLALMYELGYRRFMLCDNVCNYVLDKAVKAWEDFINE